MGFPGGGIKAVRAVPMGAEQPIRVAVVLADDLRRDLLGTALTHLAGVAVITTPQSVALALPVLVRAQCQVVVVEGDGESQGEGAALVSRLRGALPRLGVVVLPPGWGARHFPFSGPQALERLRRAITSVASQCVVLDPGEAATPPSPDSPLAHLSMRELRLLHLIAQGLSNAAIAERLRVGEKTVDNQISMLYQGLGLGRDRADTNPRVLATLLYLRHGERPGPAALPT